MWGVSTFIALGGVAVVLLAMALIVGLSPLVAVGVFVLALPLILLVLRREPGEPGSEPRGGERHGGKPSWVTKHWYE